jgi:NADPH:quinone reductase-like Zn-dependent oxidoreductase
MQYLTAYGALIHYAHIGKDDFVVLTAASSSVGIAAIEMVKAEGAISIATTRTSKKKEILTKLGAAHVIATAEEDLPARIRAITNGRVLALFSTRLLEKASNCSLRPPHLAAQFSSMARWRWSRRRFRCIPR